LCDVDVEQWEGVLDGRFQNKINETKTRKTSVAEMIKI